MESKKYFIPPVLITCLTASLISAPLTNDQEVIPSKNYNIPSLNVDFDQNTNYGVNLFNNIEDESIKNYSNFINNIINNSKNIDPEITKLVDDNFWDLLL